MDFTLMGKMDTKSKMGSKIQDLMSPKASATLSTLGPKDTDTYEAMQSRRSFSKQPAGLRVPLPTTIEMNEKIESRDTALIVKLAEKLPPLSALTNMEFQDIAL